MALSERMLAVIQKIEAADAAHFASLRESAKKETDARATTWLRKRTDGAGRAVLSRSAKRTKPPIKKPPLRTT